MGRKPSAASVKSAMKATQGGGNLASSMPRIPTPFIKRPWYYWTYDLTQEVTVDNTGVAIKASDVLLKLRTELQIDPSASLRFKVLKASTWAMSAERGVVQPNCESRYYDLNPSPTGVPSEPLRQFPRSTQRDIGSYSVAAGTSYVFPPLDQREILTDTNPQNDTIITDTIAVSAGTNVTTRIHIMWQTGNV